MEGTVFASGVASNKKPTSRLAAEHVDLSVEVRAEMERFTQVNVRWLAKVLSLRKTGVGTKAIHRQALAIFAAIEGAQLVARSRGGDVVGFNQTIEAYRTAGLLPYTASITD